MELYDGFSHLLARSDKCKVVLKYVSCTIFYTNKEKRKNLTKIEQVNEFFKEHDLDNMLKCRFDAFFESSVELNEKITKNEDHSVIASIKRPIRQGFELKVEYNTFVFDFYDDDYDEKNLIRTDHPEAFEFLLWRVLTSWFENETPNIIEMKLEVKKGCEK